MTERPIIMSGWSVRAILADLKTQTRRPISRRNSLFDGHPGMPYGCNWDDLDFENAWVDRGPSPAGNPGPYLKVPLPAEETVHRCYPRFWIGDRLWAKETFGCHCHNGMRPLKGCELTYRATDGDYDYPLSGWRPSIFMPRWASRITLEIEDVRVERVQDISEADAQAEGVDRLKVYGDEWVAIPEGTYKLGFQAAWDSIWAKKGHGWDVKNDWVWAISFRRLP